MWFKVDDQLAFHRKTLRAGNAAMGLWVRAGSWLSGQNRDDAPGVITYAELRTMGTAAEIRKLIDAGGPGEAGFLEPVKHHGEKACRFHDWAEFQPISEHISDKRAAWSERKRRSRAHRAGDHSWCLPEYCENAPPLPENPSDHAQEWG